MCSYILRLYTGHVLQQQNITSLRGSSCFSQATDKFRVSPETSPMHDSILSTSMSMSTSVSNVRTRCHGAIILYQHTYRCGFEHLRSSSQQASGITTHTSTRNYGTGTVQVQYSTVQLFLLLPSAYFQYLHILYFGYHLQHDTKNSVTHNLAFWPCHPVYY